MYWICLFFCNITWNSYIPTSWRYLKKQKYLIIISVSNIRLRCQLPISVQEQCWLRVEDEVKYYEEGKIMIFDDSFDHEVLHEGFLSNRVVLLIDFFHPDLTIEEKELLKEYFPK